MRRILVIVLLSLPFFALSQSFINTRDNYYSMRCDNALDFKCDSNFIVFPNYKYSRYYEDYDRQINTVPLTTNYSIDLELRSLENRLIFTYHGNLVNGNRHGHGIIKYEGDYWIKEYDGDWIDNKAVDENCTVKLKEGYEYSGGFSSGDFNGEGRLLMGSSSWEGIWQDGKLVKGKHIVNDKIREEGEFRNYEIVNGVKYDEDGKIEAKYQNGKEIKNKPLMLLLHYLSVALIVVLLFLFSFFVLFGLREVAGDSIKHILSISSGIIIFLLLIFFEVFKVLPQNIDSGFWFPILCGILTYISIFLFEEAFEKKVNIYFLIMILSLLNCLLIGYFIKIFTNYDIGYIDLFFDERVKVSYSYLPFYAIIISTFTYIAVNNYEDSKEVIEKSTDSNLKYVFETVFGFTLFYTSVVVFGYYIFDFNQLLFSINSKSFWGFLILSISFIVGYGLAFWIKNTNLKLWGRIIIAFVGFNFLYFVITIKSSLANWLPLFGFVLGASIFLIFRDKSKIQGEK